MLGWVSSSSSDTCKNIHTAFRKISFRIRNFDRTSKVTHQDSVWTSYQSRIGTHPTSRATDPDSVSTPCQSQILIRNPELQTVFGLDTLPQPDTRLKSKALDPDSVQTLDQSQILIRQRELQIRFRSRHLTSPARMLVRNPELQIRIRLDAQPVLDNQAKSGATDPFSV